MKPIRKYDKGGETPPDDNAPGFYGYKEGDSLPVNRARVRNIRRKAEEAFDSGDMEEAKRLAAKADKIGRRLDKRKKGIEAFVKEQQRREAEHAKARARTPSSGMDQLFKELKAEQDRLVRASGNVPAPKSGSGSSSSGKYQGSTSKGSK